MFQSLTNLDCDWCSPIKYKQQGYVSLPGEGGTKKNWPGFLNNWRNHIPTLLTKNSYIRQIHNREINFYVVMLQAFSIFFVIAASFTLINAWGH